MISMTVLNRKAHQSSKIPVPKARGEVDWKSLKIRDVVGSKQ